MQTYIYKLFISKEVRTGRTNYLKMHQNTLVEECLNQRRILVVRLKRLKIGETCSYNEAEEIINQKAEIRNQGIRPRKFNQNLEAKRFKCQHCPAAFTQKYTLKLHMLRHKGEEPFQCSVCFKKFTHRKNFNYHVKTHDEIREQHTCRDCGESWLYEGQLKKHIKSPLLQDHKKCEEGSCQKIFKRASCFETHVNRVHPIPCKTCGKLMHSVFFMSNHSKLHEGGGRYQCTFCPAKFQGMYYKFEQHMRTHLGEKPFKCSQCEQSFLTNTRLKVHVESVHTASLVNCPLGCRVKLKGKNVIPHLHTHTKEKPHKCDVCAKTFARRFELTNHKRTHNSHIPNKTKTFDCKICGNTLRSKQALIFHLRAHSGEKPYKCPACPYSCNQLSNYKTHLKTHTGEKNHKCGECEKSFTRAGTLRNHVKIHAPGYVNEPRPWKCSQCEKTFKIELSLKRHIHGVHSVVAHLDCPMGCGAKLKTKEGVESHVLTHTGEKPHKCTICPAAFTRPNLLKLHLKIHNGNEPFQCSVCSMKFIIRNSYKEHIKTHDKIRQYHTCPDCGESWLDKGVLRKHLKSQILEKDKRICHEMACKKIFHRDSCFEIHVKRVHPLPCRICGKLMKSVKLLAEHEKLHDKGEFECNLCPKKLRSKFYLDIHMKTHKGDKPFKCHVTSCDKSYNTKDRLKRHQEIHNGEKPFKCETCHGMFSRKMGLDIHTATCRTSVREKFFICNADSCEMSFYTSDDLKMHQKTHSGEKPYNCATCPDMFSTKRGLDTHIKKHHAVGVIIFKCAAESCDKSYYTSSELKKHQKTHNGEKQFICNFCQEPFTSEHNLNLHILSHTNERPFPCSECELSFRNFGARTAHENRMHGKKIPEIQCPSCPKKFFFETQLRKHSATHTGEKNHPCPTCKKKFRDKQSVKLHIVYAHLNERPHVCSICSKSFGHVSNMVRHMKTHNNGG